MPMTDWNIREDIRFIAQYLPAFLQRKLTVLITFFCFLSWRTERGTIRVWLCGSQASTQMQDADTSVVLILYVQKLLIWKTQDSKVKKETKSTVQKALKEETQIKMHTACRRQELCPNSAAASLEGSGLQRPEAHEHRKGPKWAAVKLEPLICITCPYLSVAPVA